MKKPTKEELKDKAESIKRVVSNLIAGTIDIPDGTIIRDYPLVLIEWSDVMSADIGLMFPEEINFAPCKAKIVGFLVKETDEAYYIAKEMWETGQCKYIHAIPKNTAIHKVITLQTRLKPSGSKSQRT